MQVEDTRPTNRGIYRNWDFGESVLLAERDEVPIADFVSRLPVWPTLLRHEKTR